MSVVDNGSKQPKPKRRQATLRIIGLIALIWIGLLARDALALKSDWAALQHDIAMLSDVNAKLDLASLQTHVSSASFNLQALRIHTAPLMIFAPLLSGVPKYGGDIQAAPALLNLAVELSSAGDHALSTLAPIWPPKADGDRSAIEWITHSLSEHQADLQAVQINIDRAGTYRSTIDASRLSDRVKALLDKFDEVYPAARAGSGLLAIAPQLLGNDQPRTYLILFQNEDELRATGGFISAAGRVILNAGRIVSLTVTDGNLVDDYRHKPYEDVPTPMAQIMGDGLWLFRDANWSPDFPTSAQKAAYLFDYGQGGGPFDGVIALNQRVVQAIVAAIEPLEVNPGSPSVTTNNIIEYMHTAWGPDTPTDSRWLFSRKDFIGRLSHTMLERILHSPADIKWTTLMRGLLDRLNSHDLMISLNFPSLDQSLALADWNGSLRKAPGDYLMTVDTNLGYNKVNAAITETLKYSAALQPDRSIVSGVDLAFWNNNAARPGCEPGPPNYGVTTTYVSLINMCYWNYLRVLAPGDAQLIDWTPQPVPAEYVDTGIGTDGSITVTPEMDKISFGSLLVIERGQSTSRQLHYSLPPNHLARNGDTWIYRLVWQRQAGEHEWPVEFTLSWPPNWKPISIIPAPNTRTSQSMTFNRQLSFDLNFEIRFTLDP